MQRRRERHGGKIAAFVKGFRAYRFHALGNCDALEVIIIIEHFCRNLRRHGRTLTDDEPFALVGVGVVTGGGFVGDVFGIGSERVVASCLEGDFGAGGVRAKFAVSR